MSTKSTQVLSVRFILTEQGIAESGTPFSAFWLIALQIIT